MTPYLWTERWTRLVTVSSLIGLACGSGGAGSTGSADTEPGPTGSTTVVGTGSDGATSAVDSGDDATAGDGATDSDGATDTGDDDGCRPALSDCPNGMVRGCPLDLVGTEIMSDRMLGVTCTPGCPGPTTALEMYDPATGQRVTLAETEPEIIPFALALAADGSVVVGGARKPLWWEPPVAGTLHRFALDGALSWIVEVEDASFNELVVLGDEILGHTIDGVVAYALADGSPTWTIPTDLIPIQLAAASDGTLYVYGWEGIAPFQGIHVLAFDPAHALQWDFVDAPVPDEERRLEEMIVDETGGLILAARVTLVPDANEVIELRKLDVTGMEVWSAMVDTGTVRSESRDDRVFDVVARAGGGAIAVGRAANARGGLPMAVAFDADGNELWSDTGEVDLQARLEHAVRIGDQAFAMGCGNGEWIVPFPP